MKVGTIDRNARQVPVLFADDGTVYDLQAALELLPADLCDGFDKGSARSLTLLRIIEAGEQGTRLCRAVAGRLASLGEARVPQDQVRRLAPLPRTPKNVFCVGRNYAEHIQEDNVSRDKSTPVPEHAQFFTKPATAIVGDRAAVRYDERVTRRLDYEVELAVVIGRAGRDITEEDAFKHVFGYTIVNDISARDLQRRHDQWFKGKALDDSCPMGPWIVTADEIADPHGLRILLSVNGQPRQDASTSEMIFSVPKLIASLSAGLTLEPGDVIATGTPSGVGYAMNPRQWLKGGDVIECRIEGIGTLTNTVMSV